MRLGFMASPIAAAALLIGPGVAQAAITYNADLASPGVYFGAGNPNGSFAINTVDGVELGLRAKEFMGPSPVPVDNVYNIDLGKVISFDWSFNPGAHGSAVSLAALTSLLSITNVGTGGSFSFNPFLVPDNATSLLAPGGSQNSWRLSFGFLNGPGGLSYNKNLDATYRIDWTVSGDAIPSISDRIIINQGAGAVPEPGTWALMILGFGGVGAVLRRRARAGGTELVAG